MYFYLMKGYKPRENDIVGEIKKQVEKFIEDSFILNETQKKALKEELGTSWIDNRFNGHYFINDAIGLSVQEWKRENLELVDLWKQIAINNASCNNNPHKVADEAVEQFQKSFSCDNNIE